MTFNKARYVAICQHLLTTALVLAMGVTAAGVLTLEIITPQPSAQNQVQNQAPDQVRGQGLDAPGQAPGRSTSSTEDSDRAPLLERSQEATQSDGPAADQPMPTQDAPAPEKSTVNVAPVQPKVREVALSLEGIDKSSRTTATPQPASPSADPTAETDPTAEASAQPSTQPTDAPTDAEHDHAQEPAEPGTTVVAMSRPEAVSGYATVGVTWASGELAGEPVAEDDLTISVRTETDGSWTKWTDAEYHDDHGPDAREAQDARTRVRPGTDALVIGDVDRVQVRAEVRRGVTLEDVQLAIVDPGVGKQAEEAPEIDTGDLPDQATEGAETTRTDGAGDEAVALQSATTDDGTTDGSVDGEMALAAMTAAPRPYIYSRAQWGANESLRDGSPRYGSIKTGFVHHTVNANGYSRADVPSLLRGIYAYHTQSRGWSDIGYNFLVDRFGRIWEGRAGGVARPVIGAHTLGYNEYSFAMSAIGNFDVAGAPQAMVDAYKRLFAWKLSLHNINASATRIYVKNRYFAAINGHRDADSTACPGRYLYAKLPEIRTGARNIQQAAQAPPPYNPTAAPLAAVSQPKGLSFPSALNHMGGSRPDLVTVDGNGVLRTFRGGGVTGFAGTVDSGGDWSGLRSIAMVGDMSGDGRPDFINRNRYGVGRLYQGTSTGRFAQTGRAASTHFRYMSMLAGAGDLNRDGHPDVVGRHYRNGGLYLIPGIGKGRVGKPVLLNRTWSRNIARLHTAADLTRDGRPDVVATMRSGAVVLLRATGETLAAPQALPKLPRGAFRGSGDFDGNGVNDLVFSRGNQWYAYVGKRGGGFATRLFGPIDGPTGLTRVAIVRNIRGSAHPDIVGITGIGRARVAVHNGQRNFISSVRTADRITPADAILNVGDWNGDGRNDIITRHFDGDMLMLRTGLGDGRFARGQRMSTGWKNIDQLTAVGDVTGDGHPDLVGRVGTGAMRLFAGDGRKGFEAPRWAPRYLHTFGALHHAYWRTYEIPSSILGSADGTFVPIGGDSQAIPSQRRSAFYPSSFDLVVGSGDWNSDGMDDVVVRERANGRLWLLPATGGNALGGRIYLGSGLGGYSALG